MNLEQINELEKEWLAENNRDTILFVVGITIFFGLFGLAVHIFK